MLPLKNAREIIPQQQPWRLVAWRRYPMQQWLLTSLAQKGISGLRSRYRVSSTQSASSSSVSLQRLAADLKTVYFPGERIWSILSTKKNVSSNYHAHIYTVCTFFEKHLVNSRSNWAFSGAQIKRNSTGLNPPSKSPLSLCWLMFCTASRWPSWSAMYWITCASNRENSWLYAWEQNECTMHRVARSYTKQK